MRKLRLEIITLKWLVWPGSKTPTPVFFHCVNSLPLFLWVTSSVSPIRITPYIPNPPQTLLLSESPPTPTPRASINPGICSEIKSDSDWPGTHPWGYPCGRIYSILLLISVQFGRSVESNYLLPHGLQHARLPCPSPTPRAYLNSCPSNWWWHPTVSSSVVPFSSCFPSFPASGSFQMSQLFTSGGQSIGVSASASVLPTNSQDWFPLGWTGWISLQSKWLSRVLSNTTVQKHQFFGTQLSFFFFFSFLCSPTLTSIHDYWKNHSFD